MPGHMMDMDEELPPRTRRIHTQKPLTPTICGTTSAYAENTHRVKHRCRLRRNYLRVRGEYLVALLRTYPTLELPPRTRRIRRGGLQYRGPLGTTSAYAENTPRSNPTSSCCWNYLRVRGEYIRLQRCRSNKQELPPRTRRIRGVFICAINVTGTTSAYAENTP